MIGADICVFALFQAFHTPRSTLSQTHSAAGLKLIGLGLLVWPDGTGLKAAVAVANPMFVLYAAGYTLFVEDESARANALLSRGDMEAVMVVHLAGRSAEKLAMGEGEVRQQAGWGEKLNGQFELRVRD